MFESKLSAMVLTEDQLFGKMIEMELERIGFSFGNDDDLSLLVIDLDSVAKTYYSNMKASFIVVFSHLRNEQNIDIQVKYNAFLRRPFRISELLSTVISGMKIQQNIGFDKPATQRHQSKLRVDKSKSIATYGDKKFELSEYEVRVLDLLCQRQGEPVSREEICALLGGGTSNMADVYICHLRSKIDDILGLKLILTVRSKGYMLK